MMNEKTQELVKTIFGVLEQGNHNLILRGGNGAGKTFIAKEVAKKIINKKTNSIKINKACPNSPFSPLGAYWRGRNCYDRVSFSYL